MGKSRNPAFRRIRRKAARQAAQCDADVYCGTAAVGCERVSAEPGGLLFAVEKQDACLVSVCVEKLCGVVAGRGADFS